MEQEVILNLLNSIVGVIVIVGIFLLIAAGIGFFVWWWFKKRITYDVDIDVKIRREDSQGNVRYDEWKDVGGFKKDKHGMIEKFHLKKAGRWTKPPKPEWMDRTGNRRKLNGVLINDTFFPVVKTVVQGVIGKDGKPEDYTEELKIVDKDMSFFTINVLEELERKFGKQGFMEKYGAIIMIAVGVMLNLIFVYVNTSNMIQISANINSASGNFKQAMEATQNMCAKQQVATGNTLG